MTFIECLSKLDWDNMAPEEVLRWEALVKDKRNLSLTLASKGEANDTYYNLNKEDLLEKKKQKINCPLCGQLTTNGNLARHKKTPTCKIIYEIKKEHRREIDSINKDHREEIDSINKEHREEIEEKDKEIEEKDKEINRVNKRFLRRTKEVDELKLKLKNK